MSIIVTTRNDSLVDENGIASLRFANLLEELVDTVNALRALPVNTQDRDYTFILTDANGDRNACPLFHGTLHEVGKGV